MHLKLAKDFVFIWILLSIFETSCSLEQSSTYFPLEEGLKWRYQVTKTTRDGVRQQKYIYISLDDRIVEGQTVSVRKSVDGSLFYYRETEAGILYVGKEIQSGVARKFLRDEHYILRYPLQLRKQWQDTTTTKLLVKTGPPQKTVFRIDAKIPLKVLIDTLDETIVVPAGIFHHCIKISKQGSEFKDAGNYIGRTIIRVKETSWYAPGVGLVKSIREETTESQALDKGQLIIELDLFES
jgi:hypothetical protein